MVWKFVLFSSRPKNYEETRGRVLLVILSGGTFFFWMIFHLLESNEFVRKVSHSFLETFLREFVRKGFHILSLKEAKGSKILSYLLIWCINQSMENVVILCFCRILIKTIYTCQNLSLFCFSPSCSSTLCRAPLPPRPFRRIAYILLLDFCRCVRWSWVGWLFCSWCWKNSIPRT